MESTIRFIFRLKAAKISDYIKKLFKQKLFRIKFRTKKSAGAHVYPPQEWSYGAPKIDMFQILCCTEMGKYIHFRTQRCKKYWLHQKMLQMKIIQNYIFQKKKTQWVHMSTSPQSKARYDPFSNLWSG